MNSRATLLNDLIASLRRAPNDWRWTYPDRRFSIRHVSGVEIYVGVGECRVDRPRTVAFGLWGYMRLRSAFRHWRRVQRAKTADLTEQNAALVLRTFRGIAQ